MAKDGQHEHSVSRRNLLGQAGSDCRFGDLQDSTGAGSDDFLDVRLGSRTLGGITLNQTGRELECMLLMMLIYLILSLIISSLMNLFNSAMKLKER